MILNRNFRKIDATDEKPEHWEYETCDMSREAYGVYQSMESQMSEQRDAIIELAEIITGMEG